MTTFSRKALDDAKAHARREYPRESCGIIFRGGYVALQNIAEDPEKDFRIAPQVYANFAAKGGIEAVIHSHPGGPLFPTQIDMEFQQRTAVPWGIVPLIDEEGEMRVGDPFFWGDQLPRAPLLGRQFQHGIHDCYSLIRDIFQAGKAGLAEQGVSTVWPFDPIQLPDIPRDDNWWTKDQDLYRDNLKGAGFRIIDRSQARAGDCFLMGLMSKTLNHGGALVTNDTIMHHLPKRVSRREPAGAWGLQADLWVRHEAADA